MTWATKLEAYLREHGDEVFMIECHPDDVGTILFEQHPDGNGRGYLGDLKIKTWVNVMLPRRTVVIVYLAWDRLADVFEPGGFARRLDVFTAPYRDPRDVAAELGPR